MNFTSPELGDVLCLGRQGFLIPPGSRDWEQAQQILAEAEPGRMLESLAGSSGYAETLFKYLGARSVVAVDMSPFEGAEIVHDLNKPVPPELERKFDLIFDGGTLEHVFNFPVAVANVKTMLRPGGLFIGVNPANNLLGHGFYQFSPELLWRVYSEAAGFTVEKMQLVPRSLEVSPIDVFDTPGLRQQIGGTAHATYVMVAARRSSNGAPDDFQVYQSDYTAAWTRDAALKATLEEPTLDVGSAAGKAKDFGARFQKQVPFTVAMQLVRRFIRLVNWFLTPFFVRKRPSKYAARRREKRRFTEDYKLVSGSGYFDSAWYLKQYSDVALKGQDPITHYLTFGAAEFRNPGLRFNTAAYLRLNPDVARSGLNPLIHYLRYGSREGRSPVGAPKTAPSTAHEIVGSRPEC